MRCQLEALEQNWDVLNRKLDLGDVVHYYYVVFKMMWEQGGPFLTSSPGIPMGTRKPCNEYQSP